MTGLGTTNFSFRVNKKQTQLADFKPHVQF